MSSDDLAIKVENISKCYRIGLKEEMHENFSSAIFDFIKSPIKNYQKYRSLYKFDDRIPDAIYDSNSDSSDIIWALKNVSFEVKRGEVLGIIGSNGAGKSTLLKILCRITDPATGLAKIHGRVSSLLEVGTGFHPELSGKDNVYLNGSILGMTKKEVDSRFDEIVAFSGVEKFIYTPVKRYSSGMKVRLAFSVAAHLEPEILIIDEVLAVGDASFQKKCIGKMESVGKEGRTVLFVSHNMPAVTRLCQRAILLDAGKVAEDGPANTVANTYLKSSTSMSVIREWPNPESAPGGDVARLNSVRLRTEDGNSSEMIDIRTPFRIEVEYEVLKPDYVLLPYIKLFTEQGIQAFTTIDNDPEWRKRNRPVGRYVSMVNIPANLLSEGTIYVQSCLITLDPHLPQFSERDVLAFQIVDSNDGDSARADWVGPMSGVVRPLLKWDTKFSPNSHRI